MFPSSGALNTTEDDGHTRWPTPGTSKSHFGDGKGEIQPKVARKGHHYNYIGDNIINYADEVNLKIMKTGMGTTPLINDRRISTYIN